MLCVLYEKYYTRCESVCKPEMQFVYKHVKICPKVAPNGREDVFPLDRCNNIR